MIPKVVYYTHENIEAVKKFEYQIQYSKSKNKEYKFIFFDDNDRKKFIKKEFPDFYNFYDRINEGYGAAKADIFRVLILYKYGGIYIDCKTIIEDMDELFSKYPNKNFYTSSRYENDKILYTICKNLDLEYTNFFMATQKKDKIISKIKDEMFYMLSSFGKVKKNKLIMMSDKLFNIFGDEKCGLSAVHTYTGPCIFTKIINKFPDIVFNVGLVDKIYVSYTLDNSVIERLIQGDFKISYHFNKLPLLKDV
jgi:hypothetical protein